jgi:hypothetical protein
LPSLCSRLQLVCYKDFNEGILVLHRARDELLKYLGKLDKSTLSTMSDVWASVFSHTSTLISWYRYTEGAIGAEMLVDWMLENGPYRSKFQLPHHYIPELPLNPWPTFQQFDDFKLDEVRRHITSKLPELINEFYDAPVQDALPLHHNTDCTLEFNEKIDVAAQFYHTLMMSDSSPPTPKLDQLQRMIEHSGFKIHRIGYSALSSRASTMPKYGESNTILNVLSALPASSEATDACLAVTCHYKEVRSLAARRVVLHDDSFFTSMSNECDSTLGFLFVDIVHPQFRVD